MKNLLLTILLITAGAVSAFAQKTTARQLYLGYESNAQLAAEPSKTAQQPTRENKGKPGTKIVIERMRGGKLAFVSPNSRFRSGDKIRLRFATNFSGYLKIVNLGSSGKINVLFPYEGSGDRIEPSKDFQVPQAGDWIVFDNKPGTEVLALVMSSKPFEIEDEKALTNVENRDLMIMSEPDATYAVADESALQTMKVVTLRLKHR